jgi:hypothetical protein
VLTKYEKQLQQISELNVPVEGMEVACITEEEDGELDLGDQAE